MSKVQEQWVILVKALTVSVRVMYVEIDKKPKTCYLSFKKIIIIDMYITYMHYMQSLTKRNKENTSSKKVESLQWVSCGSSKEKEARKMCNPITKCITLKLPKVY